jgi:hypothetical protein
MATRRDIKDAIYDELVSVATGTYTVTDDNGNTSTITLSSDDIDLIGPEYPERHPAVFYQPQTFRHVNYNGLGNGPDHVEKDSSGVTTYTEWREYVDSQFFVYIRANHPVKSEPIYEAVRRRWQQYDMGMLESADLHSDVTNVDLIDSTPSNTLDNKPHIWGDQIELAVEFVRRIKFETGVDIGTIEEIDLSVERGYLDGVYDESAYGSSTYDGTELTYTIT